MRLWQKERKGDWNGRLVEGNSFSCRYFKEVGCLVGDASFQTAEVDCWPGNDRICDLGRRARGHCNHCHRRVQGQDSRAVGFHQRKHSKSVGTRFLLSCSGQSTVEFAVVTAGFIGLSLALMALWRVIGDGVLVEHALAVASHHIQAVFPTTVADIFLY